MKWSVTELIEVCEENSDESRYVVGSIFSAGYDLTMSGIRKAYIGALYGGIENDISEM